MAVAALALAGAFVAAYLTLYKLGVFGELVCAVGSCETVNASRWAVLLGAPVAAWGVAFYVVVLAVALVGVTGRHADSLAVGRSLLALSTGGFLFSAWLTYLELFVIRAVCQWCVVSAVLATTIFVLSWLDYRELASEPSVG